MVNRYRNQRHQRARTALLAVLLALAGCQNLPIAGPLASEVEGEVPLLQRVPFRLVRLTPEMVPVIQESVPEAERFITDLGPSEPRIGAGDVLVVTIVEPSAGGLFSGPPSITASGAEPGARVVTLPELTVDPDGRVALPFAGIIAVGGLTQVEAAGRIQGALTGQAVRPQVMVNLARGNASRITVSGAVKTPGSLPVRSGGERLLEAVARAGGAAEPPQNVIVQLTRFGQPHRVRMQTLLDQPQTDIHVRSGDYIHLIVSPRTYLVMGATGKVDEQTLANRPVPLAAGLATAGGLLDARADATALMLFRTETPAVLDRLAAIEARLARARGEEAPIPPPIAHADPSAPVPVIFLVDLRSASGLFMAQQLDLREHDLVYAPNSAFAQVQKFLDLVRLTTNPITTGAYSYKTF